MTARQSTWKTLCAAIALALACLVALSSLPVPALAEMAEGAMGEEPASAQVAGRDETRGNGAAAGDAGLAPMAEEGTADDAPTGGELADEGPAAQGAMVPDESEAAEAPAGGEGEPGLSTQSVGQLYNPRIASSDRLGCGQIVTWDCVWLGSYPQTEVPETDALRNAGWADGDATVDGVRYRRITKSDATYSGWWGYDDAYHYFRYEPIKWRILEVSGNTAFAVADKALDCRQYHKSEASVTWETSTIRSWLNGKGGIPYYSVGAQSGRTAQAFTSVAFTEDQLGAVQQSTIANAGGNATTDRVFLLSESEVDGASAAAYGFVPGPDTSDAARVCHVTDYSRVMGADELFNVCYWWLRSPGSSADYAAHVFYGGYVSRDGNIVNDDKYAVRPALNLNLSSPHLTWAGTVSSDGTVRTNAKPGSVPPFSDLTPDSWYVGVVNRASDLGLMSGYPNGKFGPADKITRGQVAVTLWNMAGNPAVGAGAKSFEDVRSGDYSYNAVRWASSKGVVSGYGNGKFGPKDNVTREQLAVMLANYARNVKGQNVTGSAADFASMADKDKVSSWAVTSVGWCFRNKILSGSGGKVNPAGTAARAEAAKMVVGLYDLLG